ncbi:MAG: hypothetical protein ACRCZF_00895 [Gemmataceae bacterium]
MNSSDAIPDDSPWNDLAAELGLDSHPAPKYVPESEVESTADFLADDDGADGSEHDTVIIPALNGEPITGEDGDDGGDGTGPGGKKRRRRRRRRKKTGAPGEGGEGTGGDDDGDSDESMEDEADSAPVLTADQETIRNWDVPSWEEIVRGLYRPER